MTRLFAVSSAGLLAALVGCGGAHNSARSQVLYDIPPGPPVELDVDQVYYVPGEQMTWEISLRDIVGGEAILATGNPGNLDGRHTLIVRSQVRSAGMLKLIKDVRDDVTTWVDLTTGEPIKHVGSLKFGKKESEVATEFNGGGYVLDYHRIGKRRIVKRQHMPGGATAHDGHSILGVLRAWEPEDGTRAYFYVLSGKRLWRNDVVLRARETIKTKLGLTPALRIDGIATKLTGSLRPDRKKKPRRFTLWISDDANRVPLLVKAKTEYGDVKVELVSYERPGRTVVWR